MQRTPKTSYQIFVPKCKSKISHNVDADEGDENVLTGKVGLSNFDTNNRDDELANTHSDRTNEKESATTKAFNAPDTWESHEHVDNTSCNRNEEAVLDAGVGEESGAVVENEVNY